MHALGIDTGGTYTDAVIVESASGQVRAKAKAPTTRHDLSVGIAAAAGVALEQSGVDPSSIELVSISTTLATNALVEGQGGRVGLIMIGFGPDDLAKAGLGQALGSDPVAFVPGGHDVHGKPAPFDLDAAADDVCKLCDGVDAVAVAGYFAVRNPAHEIAMRDFIRAETGLPVTCSHELTGKLDGPKRALTTLLNGRLIGMIARLITATQNWLAETGVKAPLMVVRGDGSLVSADFARARPIETILSGPAASLVGAAHLTGLDKAIVSDIGGTTTDIAILDEGRPRLDPQGATVGGYRTMVDAVAMRTFGLAGDSEVTIDEGALEPVIRLGPRRLVPLSMLAAHHGASVLSHLERQLAATIGNRHDGRFVLATGVGTPAGLTRAATDVFNRLSDMPQPLDRFVQSNADIAAINQLVARGLALLAGFTPSDAQHVVGRFTHWSTDAARLGAALFARKKDGYGKPLAALPADIAEMVVMRLIALSAEITLETALCEDGLDGVALARSVLARRALEGARGHANFSVGLDRSIVGLGAAAGAYYPAIASRLGTVAVIPEHADVANAIGAVVGQVRVSAEIDLTLSESGHFLLGGAALQPGVANGFADEATAIATGETLLREHLLGLAREAGAADPVVTVDMQINAVDVDGRRQFVSGCLTGHASGRPALVG